MPSTQSIRAGRAFVDRFADESKLVRGLRAAERKVKAFGANVRPAYADAEDAAARALVKKPVAVYIEKVYEEGDFAGLGIGT